MPSLDPFKLAAAYTVDLAAGDPPGLPHPVRLMGAAISLGDRICKPGRRPVADFLNGLVLSTLLVASSWLAGWLLLHLARFGPPALEASLEIMLAWTTLATGSLVSEAGHAVRKLEARQFDEARHAVSMIVGRDTAALDESELARAVIETVAESLCDGVAAPLFYLALGGVPLALAYKALNTLDSMIGHPEPPYTYFGRFAARADDVANFLPARFTAGAIILAAGPSRASWRNAYRTWLQDGGKHPSPNAGQSEAPMAGALHVRLGGTNYYQGRSSKKPVIGADNPAPTREDARRSLLLARFGSLALFAAAFAWCSWKRLR